MKTRGKISSTFITHVRIRILYLALIAIMAGAGVLASFHSMSAADAAPRQAPAPRIVENGVKVVDAWNMPAAGWQVWLARPPGDDTYGRGDLLAVSVEFTENVTVDPNAVFRFQTGWPNGWRDKELVYAAQEDNVVFFATTIRGSWYAPDGIRIGDHTETLGANQPDYIQSAATGVNADLTHPALGRLPQHKVQGAYSRPNVTRFELLATSCDESYLRDEMVTVKVTFDQSVRVRGTPQAVIKIRSASGKQQKRASYVRGSGSNAIFLEYQVTKKDNDPRGIRIDQNSMLIRRSDGLRPLNNGSVVGARGGLLADLRTRGIARSQAAGVDGSRKLRLYCETPLPEVPANVSWKWNEEQDLATSYSATFTILTDPGLGSGLRNTTFTAGSMHLNNYRFHIGLNSNFRNPRQEELNPAKIAFCGSWDPSAANAATPNRKGWVIQPKHIQGNPVAVVLPYDWTEGTYTMMVKHVLDEVDGTTFKCYVTAHGTDPENGQEIKTKTLIGSFRFTSASDDTAPRINPNTPLLGSGIAFGGTKTARPIDLPVMSVAMERPKLAEMRRPRHALVTYSPVHRKADNGLVTFDSSNQTVTLTAGGGTSHEGINRTGTRYTFNARR